MKHFFISYSSADRAWAEWVAWELEEEGYTTIIAARDFHPSSNWAIEMQKAAAQAERTMIEDNVRRKKRKNKIDKIAAALILQSYLDAQK